MITLGVLLQASKYVGYAAYRVAKETDWWEEPWFWILIVIIIVGGVVYNAVNEKKK